MSDSRPSRGERIEDVTQNAVRLAHRVVDRFPHVKRKHMVVAGGAALSSAIIAAAAVAVAKRITAGSSDDDAVNDVTEGELEHPDSGSRSRNS